MAVRDDETVTDADLVRRGSGPIQAPGSIGAAVVGPSVASSQRRLRDDGSARVRPLTSRRWFVIGGGAILPIVLLAAWQLATTTGVVSVSVFPSPAMVWAAAVDLAQRGDLYQDVAISTQRVLIGFGLGSALGLVVGALFGLSRIWEVVLGPTLGAIRAVPSLAWVPLLLLWMGIGEESKITLITIGAFFPVFTTVATALGHVDRHLVEAGRAFGLSGVRLFTTVQLPAVIPSVIAGLRLALAQSWLFLVASELIASSMGLGFRLIDSQNNGRIDRVFLAIILLAVLGKLTDAIVGVFQRYAVRKWA